MAVRVISLYFLSCILWCGHDCNFVVWQTATDAVKQRPGMVGRLNNKSESTIPIKLYAITVFANSHFQWLWSYPLLFVIYTHTCRCQEWLLPLDLYCSHTTHAALWCLILKFHDPIRSNFIGLSCCSDYLCDKSLYFIDYTADRRLHFSRLWIHWRPSNIFSAMCASGCSSNYW